MKIIKGQHLHISHKRKGAFDAIATRDFDTDLDTLYPVAVANGSLVRGMSLGKYWDPGEDIPCRNSLCTLELVSQPEKEVSK